MTRRIVLVDGANCWAAAQSLGFNIDYAKFRTFFLQFLGDENTRFVYYTAVKVDANGQSNIQHLLTWLRNNGYSVKSKEAKDYVSSNGRVRTKGNMDIEMCVDALSLAENDRVDHIIFATGDGDFTYLVQRLKQLNVRVSVLSTRESRPPMVSERLRQEADEFLELASIKDHVQQVVPAAPSKPVASDSPVDRLQKMLEDLKVA